MTVNSAWGSKTKRGRSRRKKGRQRKDEETKNRSSGLEVERERGRGRRCSSLEFNGFFGDLVFLIQVFFFFPSPNLPGDVCNGPPERGRVRLKRENGGREPSAGSNGSRKLRSSQSEAERRGQGWRILASGFLTLLLPPAPRNRQQRGKKTDIGNYRGGTRENMRNDAKEKMN